MQITAKNIDTFLLGLIGKNIEDVNEQFRITKRKLDQGLFVWSMLSNPEKSDLHTKREHIKKKFERYEKNFWNTWPTCFDPGCGDGEFLAEWQEQLRNANCPEEEIAKRIYWADPEPANVILTAQRLGISINNSFSYQVGKIEEIYINKRGVVKTRKLDITQESFKKGLGFMAFDINKVHLIGNLPFTYGKGNAPVAIPVLTYILSLGCPQTINLVNDAGFLTSSSGQDFRELLKQNGWKYVGYNPQDLFDAGGATVYTVDLFCEQGYNSDIEIKSITKETFTVSRGVNYIVDGGSKELTEFLYTLLDKVKAYGCLLNKQSKTSWQVSKKEGITLDSKYISDIEKEGFVKTLIKMQKSGNTYRYVDAKTLDINNKYKVVFGYLPSGLSHSLSIGLTTILDSQTQLPKDPYRFFEANTETHAQSLQAYVTSNVVDKFILPATRINKTFDAKTPDGVTKFIPALPEGIVIKNDDDVFDFLETPDYIREAVRARF